MGKQGAVTQELEAYIEQNLLPGGNPRQDLMDEMGGSQSFSHSNVALAFAPRSVALAAMVVPIDFLLKKIEMTFSEKLLQLIQKKGRKSSEVYTKAGLTRAHFAKIKADKDYHPTKSTALAFSVALHLDLDETADFIKRAGYTISHSSERDIIVEFFIVNKIYNIDEINNQLDMRGHRPLTNWRQPAQ